MNDEQKSYLFFKKKYQDSIYIKKISLKYNNYKNIFTSKIEFIYYNRRYKEDLLELIFTTQSCIKDDIYNSINKFYNFFCLNGHDHYNLLQRPWLNNNLLYKIDTDINYRKNKDDIKVIKNYPLIKGFLTKIVFYNEEITEKCKINIRINKFHFFKFNHDNDNFDKIYGDYDYSEYLVDDLYNYSNTYIRYKL